VFSQVLSFFSSILLDIVDATYLCYAIDKDTQTITKPDVHEIYSKVPPPPRSPSICVYIPISLPMRSITQLKEATVAESLVPLPPLSQTGLVMSRRNFLISTKQPTDRLLDGRCTETDRGSILDIGRCDRVFDTGYQEVWN